VGATRLPLAVVTVFLGLVALLCLAAPMLCGIATGHLAYLQARECPSYGGTCEDDGARLPPELGVGACEECPCPWSPHQEGFQR
jgi:hypothetical protein